MSRPAVESMCASKRALVFVTTGYPPDDIGGAERQARLQAEELVRRGYRVSVVTSCSTFRPSKTSINGVTVSRLPRPSVRLFGALLYLGSLTLWLVYKRKSYNIVHVHLANLQLDAAALASLVTRKPIHVKLATGGPSGEISRFRRVARLTRNFGLRRATTVQAISAEIADELRDLGIDQGKVVRIPNGLDLDQFRPAPRATCHELRKKLDLPADTTLVIYLGRLATYKGIPDLLTAWDRAQLGRKASLVLVGAPALDKPLVLGDLPDGVLLRQPSLRPADYLRACDVFVSPSHGEGMSNAVLEAMGCGLAVVTTSVGAAPELIEQGVSGVLCPPHAPSCLARALQRVIDDPDLRVAAGAQARSRVERRHSIAAVVDQLEELYRGLARCPCA